MPKKRKTASVGRKGTDTNEQTDFRSDPLWLKTSFGTTSPLTTPLSGFIVTDFQKAEAVTDTGTKVGGVSARYLCALGVKPWRQWWRSVMLRGRCRFVGGSAARNDCIPSFGA